MINFVADHEQDDLVGIKICVLKIGTMFCIFSEVVQIVNSDLIHVSTLLSKVPPYPHY